MIRSLVFVAALLVPVPTASAAESPRFPAAGGLTVPRAAVRARPHPDARVLRVLKQFRRDFRAQVVLALSARRGPDGGHWYRLSLPGRPNGGRGWMRAKFLDLKPVEHRITVFRSARRLEVRRAADHRLLLRAPIAVGKPGAETPLGRNFFVRGRTVPRDPFYGRFALETSAFSRLSDWPGGGIVGIHGTNAPWLIGGAVSHGCIRMRNPDVVRLGRLAQLGTPIDIRP